MAGCHAALTVPEILAHILKFTIGGRSVGLLPLTTSPTTTTPPWPFLLVCKFWKELALDTPSLWSTFDAINHDARYENIFHLPFMLKKHLERSGSRPLTLSMRFSFVSRVKHGERNPFEIIRKLLQKAQKCQDRWYDVTIELGSLNSFSPNDFSVSPPRPPKLVRLRLTLGDTPILNRFDIKTTVGAEYLKVELETSICPLLKNFSTEGCVFVKNQELAENSQSAGVFFPVMDAIRLRPKRDLCEKHNVLKYLNLLKHAVNVEKADIFICATEVVLDDPSFKSSTSVFTRLRQLAVHGVHHGDPIDLLCSMSTPFLADLQLGNIPIREDNFIKLANCLRSLPLEHLSLEFTTDTSMFFGNPRRVIIEETTVLTFMESIGGLQHLEISDPDGTVLDAFASASTVSMSSIGQASPLPQLATLKIVTFADRITPGGFYLFHTVRKLILAYKIRPGNFHFGVRFKIPGINGQENARLRNYLCSNPEVMACCSESFKVIINNLELAA